MKNRGSAYIYVLLMVVSITIVSLAIADSSVQYYKNQGRSEQQSQADYLLAGGIEQLEGLRVWTRIAVPSASSTAIGGKTVNLSVGPGTDSKSMKVTASVVVAGRTYSKTVYTGLSRPTPFYFGIASGGDLRSQAKITVGSAAQPDSIHAEGNVVLSADADVNSLVYGDAQAGGTINSSTTAMGAKYPGVPDATIFTRSGLLDYLTLSSIKYLLGQDWNGYTFSAVPDTSNYPLVHILGNLKLKGPISGRGTIYITGNLTMSGDVTYADPTSKVVFIVGGNAVITNNMAGYVYAMGNLNVNERVTVNGGLYGVNKVAMDMQTTVNFDPYIAVNPSEGTRFWLPGY